MHKWNKNNVQYKKKPLSDEPGGIKIKIYFLSGLVYTHNNVHSPQSYINSLKKEYGRASHYEIIRNEKVVSEISLDYDPTWIVMNRKYQ